MLNIFQKREAIINFILLLTSIYFLYPLLQSGYISDDAYNSLIRGSILEKNKTFGEFVLYTNSFWLNISGRLYPIAHLSQMYLFYFVKSLFLFKIIKLIIILLSIYYFRLNVIRLSNSKLIGNLCVLLLLIFFQFRQWHDPILGFAIQLPLICFFLFSSLYYFQVFLENNKKKYLARSLILYLLLLLTYEISYPLIILYMALAFFKSNLLNEVIYKPKFHYLMLFSIIIITIYFRFNVGEKSYPSLDQSFSIIPFLESFIIQTYSGLSFSYFSRLKIDFIENLQIIDLYLLVFFFVTFYLLNNLTYQKISYKKIIQFFILGAIIVLSQSFMVAISGHKKDIISMGLGFGYLPVLLEYFGFSLIYLSLILLLFLKIEKKFLKVFFSIFCSLCLTLNGTINISNNRYVVHEANKFYKYPRELLKKGLSNNKENNIKQSTIIVRNWRFPHDINWFYSKHTDKLFCIIDTNKSINDDDFSWPRGCALRKTSGELNKLRHEWAQKNKDYIGDLESWLHSADRDELRAAGVKGNEINFNDDEIIYSVSYNFDATGNQNGNLYYAKIDKIILDEKSKKISELIYEELVFYNESQNNFKNIDLKSKYNFVDIIKQDQKKISEVKVPLF